MPLVLLTNVAQYTGPGALTALLGDGHTVVCHDPSFVGHSERTKHDSQNPRALALVGQTAVALTLSAMYGRRPRCKRRI
jgi:3-oxoacyl-[acyl-carrier protein] reductase